MILKVYADKCFSQNPITQENAAFNFPCIYSLFLDPKDFEYFLKILNHFFDDTGL